MRSKVTKEEVTTILHSDECQVTGAAESNTWSRAYCDKVVDIGKVEGSRMVQVHLVWVPVSAFATLRYVREALSEAHPGMSFVVFGYGSLSEYRRVVLGGTPVGVPSPHKLKR